MTTVAPHPDPALPPGANSDDASEWETIDGVTSRLVWSKPQQVPDHLDSWLIRVVASQSPDGSVLVDKTEGPFVYIEHTDHTPADARAIAAAIVAAADLADQWAGRVVNPSATGDVQAVVR